MHKQVGDGLPPPKGVGGGKSKAQPIGEVYAELGTQSHRPQEKQTIDDDDVFGDGGQYIETTRLELLIHGGKFTSILYGVGLQVSYVV